MPEINLKKDIQFQFLFIALQMIWFFSGPSKYFYPEARMFAVCLVPAFIRECDLLRNEIR